MARSRLIASGLAGLVFVLALAGPVEYLADSRYSLLLSQSILTGGGLGLERYFPEGAPSYQLGEREGHLYHLYPNAASLLALPFVALMKPLGLSPVGVGGHYDAAGELRMQRLIACFVCAVMTGLLYLGLRAIVPPSLAAAATLGASLGSVVLSDLTRSLWPQTWAALLVGVLCWQLLEDHAGSRALRPGIVGGALAWLVLVRPPAILIASALIAYLVVARRRVLAPVLAWMSAWLAAFAALHLAVYGTLWQPQVYEVARIFDLTAWPSRARSVLVSPSRGLLVFMPWVVLALGVPLLWRRAPARRLAGTGLAAAAGYLVLLGAYVRWVGGACFGPRLWAEVVPLLALAAASGVGALWTVRQPAARRAVVVFALASLAWSFFVHARGAFAPATHEWNLLLRERADRSELLGDWSRAQFLAGLATSGRGEGGSSAPGAGATP